MKLENFCWVLGIQFERWTNIEKWITKVLQKHLSSVNLVFFLFINPCASCQSLFLLKHCFLQKLLNCQSLIKDQEKCYLKDYIVLDLSVLGNLLELGFNGIWRNYILEILEVFFVRKIKLWRAEALILQGQPASWQGSGFDFNGRF